MTQASTNTTILVTGGAGYVGSHGVLALKDMGYDVVVIDNLSTGNQAIVPDDVPLCELDIADTDAIRNVIRKHQVNAIIHYAGSVVVPESVENPLLYYHNNTVKSHGLIALAVEEKLQAFLFSSTAAVYGMPDECPVQEDAITSPINPYGASKLMTEQMLKDAHAAYGLSVGILRYFNVAGADPEGRSGQCTPNATHLIKVACQALSGKRAGIAVYGTDYSTPDGTCIRDYIHVSDLADAHVLALQNLMAGTSPQLFITNCGYKRGYSVKEVLDAAQRVSGKTLNITDAERRAGDPPILVADNTRITTLLNWQPKRDDLDTMIASALRWEEKWGH